ncbi:MAG: hypothetical protein NVSMB46_07010 [Candidatus Saccharimonadales bacterium]
MSDINVDTTQEAILVELKANPSQIEDVNVARDMAITEDELRSLDPGARRDAYVGIEVSGTDSEHRLSSGLSSDEVFAAEEKRRKETSGLQHQDNMDPALQHPGIFMHGSDEDDSLLGPNSKETMRGQARREMTDRRFSDRSNRVENKMALEEIAKAQANGVPVEQSYPDKEFNRVTIEGRKVPLGSEEVDPVVAAANLKERERSIESRYLTCKRPLKYTEPDLRSHKQLDEEDDHVDYDRRVKDVYYGKSKLGRIIKGRVLGRGKRPRELN